MKKNSIITFRVLETAPRPETGAYNIGWPAAPDLVEASDQIIWSENNNVLVNVTDNAPSP